MNEAHEAIKKQIRTLPHQPGVYQYFDKNEQIIYVGKAKNLKKRVSSYFAGLQNHSGKLKVLVKKIVSLKFIVVETEVDALLLENNLIKKYQPRYNILLKDDKTFPWICIKNEAFPRVFSTRKKNDDGSQYFGPYASGKMMKTILELIRQLYPIRTCAHHLSQKNIEAGKFKVCLDYHLGNCLGPCVGKQRTEDYDGNIKEIARILKGNIASLIQELKQKMMSYAEAMEFEKAQMLKERLEVLTSYRSKSMVVNPNIKNVDVFSFFEDEEAAYINFMKVIDGAIVQTHTLELKKKLEESPVQLLEMGIAEIRQTYGLEAEEMLLPFEISLAFDNIYITIPKIGDKKHLLELSERNAKYYQLDKKKKKDLIDPERHVKRILDKMKEELRMNELPRHIECFDNSNFQGDYPVAAMVMFKNTKPYKKGYRHYNIKTVVGPDDFASMAEVIYRRYKRLQEENADLPQLIVVDGGKGQLSAAVSSLDRLGLRGKITIVGIAKKLEEIYFPGDSLPLYIDKKSETLKIIQHTRDEAHRFGITHHRSKRDKGTLKTSLTEIKGIGPQTTELLLKKFKSVKKIKEQDLKTLEKEVGLSKAQLLIEYFKTH
ncbi:excinuclease ABC subunit UvrC [Lentimicrobium sp. S6]|uniref:excinuclease ABC subunit UvrC n=1 Tax=Lentimicrobium sp. S6 TaxID=2735872 RepID=UPI0015541892|nr:excinuclease ABC subunit UvrC [Lentimicrobium sp. S6]NPD44480.1 excinuclease ABC subunit UvrC [Lentimicrobium sp. S6]